MVTKKMSMLQECKEYVEENGIHPILKHAWHSDTVNLLGT